MSRHLLCPNCFEKYLPEGKRTTYTRSQFGEPEEYQRLVVGVAKAPIPEQRFMMLNQDRVELPLEHYDCDFCGGEIKPGDRCGALSIWTEVNVEEPQWEQDFLTVTVDGVGRA